MTDMTDTQPRDASPGHSSDDESQSNLTKNKGSPAARSDRHQKTDKKELSDSDEDEPLLTLMKKRKNKKPDAEETAVLDQTKSPRKQKTEAKASKHRQSSPSRVRTPKRRARKGKGETRKVALAHPTPEKTPPKKRGCAKKQDTERIAPSCDSSDNEPLVQLVKKKRQPEMKQAVVLLRRMSNRDIIDRIAQGHKCTQAQSNTAKADEKSKAESSDEEPLSHKVKRLKQHSKPVRGRATAGLV